MVGKITILDELDEEQRKVLAAAARVPVSPQHAAKLLGKRGCMKWCLKGYELMLLDLEEKKLLKRVSIQGREYWVAHDGAADPKNFCREPDAPEELVYAMCAKVKPQAKRRRGTGFYLRLHPNKVQEVKQKEKVDESEARELCKHITSYDLMGELLGRKFTYTDCRELLMNNPKQWAELVEQVVKKAIEEGIPPNDKKSKSALESWKRYFNIA